MCTDVLKNCRRHPKNKFVEPLGTSPYFLKTHVLFCHKRHWFYGEI
jgi:hypothetical protein